MHPSEVRFSVCGHLPGLFIFLHIQGDIMTVTIVTDVLGKENNGTTIACMNLIRSLQSKGHNVRVVCPDKDKAGLDGFYITPSFSFGKVLDKYVEKVGVVIARRDDKILETAIADADIVHLVLPFGLTRAALRIAKKYGKPVTASFHCQAENLTSHICLMNSRIANKIVYHNFYYRFYRYVDAVHYPSEFIRKEFEREIGKTTNAYVISNGVNKRYVPSGAQKPETLRNKFVILFIGRYGKEKSHKYLIRAVRKSRHCADIQLIFAGAGPLEKKLIRMSKRSRINMPIMKFYPRDELVDVISFSDLYCHPAKVEIEAIACLEAVSCGLVPVINNSRLSATRFFAISDKNLFNENDSSDFAAKIDYWIEHPEEKRNCASQYLDFAKQYDQDACMDRMENMFLEVIARNEAKNDLLQ